MAKHPYLKIPKTNIYRPYLDIRLSHPRTEKKTPLIQGLLDSGADICTAPKELALWLGITFDEQDHLAHITTADGSIRQAVKKTVIISLEEDRYECPFLFVGGIPPDQPPLLGQEGFTVTLTPTATPTMTPTVTVTVTATPTVSPTATLTPTLEPITLGLAMQIEPDFVAAGELVTMTLQLSNTASITVDNITISSTLPVDIGYDTPLGSIIPSYNPLIRLLKWDIAQLGPREEMSLGFMGQINPAALPDALSLVAEVGGDQTQTSTQAQTSLIIIQAQATPTPVPTAQLGATADPPGPPAQVQLGVKSETDAQIQMGPSQTANEKSHRLAIYVMDAEGRAVADGTNISLDVQGGTLSQNQLSTKNGVATIQLKTTPGQAASVTASAGSIQGTLQLDSHPAPENIPQLQRKEARYGEEIAAIVSARNAVQPNGPNGLRADNQSRQVDFDQGGLTFALKVQDDRLKPVGNDPSQTEPLNLGFELTDIRLGQQSLLIGQPSISTNGNWVTYKTANSAWHLAYEVGKASVEQYIVLAEEIDISGDLVIEGEFQTTTQPTLLSDEEGIALSGQVTQSKMMR